MNVKPHTKTTHEREAEQADIRFMRCEPIEPDARPPITYTYGGARLFCEVCDVTILKESGYTVPQAGICDDCLAKIERGAS